MILAFHSALSVGDVALIATLLVFAYLNIRSQRPRILQEENVALSEESKRLRTEKNEWLEQKSELLSQIRVLESRITVLEGKDTERLYDLMKSHDERVQVTSAQISDILLQLSEQITMNIAHQEEVTSVIMPLVREIQVSLGLIPTTQGASDA